VSDLIEAIEVMRPHHHKSFIVSGAAGTTFVNETYNFTGLKRQTDGFFRPFVRNISYEMNIPNNAQGKVGGWKDTCVILLHYAT